VTRLDDARRIGSVVFYGAVLLIGYLGYLILQPFLVEIGWAVVLAICLAPARDRLARRLGRVRSALLLTLLALLLLFVPALAGIGALVREGGAVVGYIRQQLSDRGGPMGLFHVVWDWLNHHFPMLPSEDQLVARVSDSLGSVAGLLASHAGTVVKGALSLFLSLLMTLAILFFLLRDSEAMTRAALRLLPFGHEQNLRLLTLTRDIVSASVTSMLAVALIQGVLGTLAFALLGIPGALLWGGLMTVLALLPAVGAALVWAPAAIWLAISGSLVKGIVLGLVGLLVLGNVDNVVRPLVLSGSARMNTLVLIISLLGGVSAFGFIGIVLGPVVAAVLTALVESYPDEAVPAAGRPLANESPSGSASPAPAAGEAPPPRPEG
jgi:predicted PurR-regulated permease PerM